MLVTLSHLPSATQSPWRVCGVNFYLLLQCLEVGIFKTPPSEAKQLKTNLGATPRDFT